MRAFSASAAHPFGPGRTCATRARAPARIAHERRSICAVKSAAGESRQALVAPNLQLPRFESCVEPSGRRAISLAIADKNVIFEGCLHPALRLCNTSICKLWRSQSLVARKEKSMERMVAVYRVRSDGASIEARAQAIALEQSVELPREAIFERSRAARLRGRGAGDPRAWSRACSRCASGLPPRVLEATLASSSTCCSAIRACKRM